MSRSSFLLFLAVLFVFCAQNVKYEVKECSREKALTGYTYENGILRAKVLVNCCSDEIKVVKQGDVYEIVEKDYDGKLCRCMCIREVVIYNVPEDFKLIFIDLSGKKHALGFCGWSTYGKCESDEDCIVAGCSSQVCAAKNESIVTTCEWKECYDAKKYGVSCKCINGRCQWAPQN